MKDLESTLSKHAERRRKFLVKSGNAAAAAPALALMLQAGVKPAFAAGYGDAGSGGDPTGGVTTGNPITVTTHVPIVTSTTRQVTSTTAR